MSGGEIDNVCAAVSCEIPQACRMEAVLEDTS